MHPPQTQGYIPIAAKGHKDSVYALGMNESGAILVSGGTKKVQYGLCFESGLSFAYDLFGL